MNDHYSRVIVDHLPLASFLLDAEDYVITMNSAAEEWLGISARKAEGQRFSALMKDSPRLAELLARGRRAGISEYDVPFELHTGVPEQVNIHVVPAEAGQAVVAIARKRYAPMQAVLDSRGEAARVSGLLAAMLAHEVKNPLAGIRGAAQLLLSEVQEDMRPFASLICEEVDRIAHVLSQVEPFSAPPPEALTAVDAHEALHYVALAARAGAARNIPVELDIETSLPPVAATREALVALLLNLVKNAAEALQGQEDARIILSTSSRQDYTLMGRAGPILPQAHLRVIDNGPGVPEAMRAHLFEPLISSKGKGRGLGLSIAAKLADDMGGLLRLEESASGKTIFCLTIGAAGSSGASL